MELLLNLAWLLLAIPAWWLWRGRAPERKLSSLHCLLALGCMLVVLFPVISATDDLCAMRAEMEESPAGKRAIRQASSERPLAWKWQSPPALMAASISFALDFQGWQPLPLNGSSLPVPRAIKRSGRAPPVFLA